MRVAILGIGSIGGVILAGLADTELELVAVSRGSTAQALSSEGLVIHTPEGVIESIPPDKNTPNGTSDIIRFSTAASRRSRMPLAKVLFFAPWSIFFPGTASQ